MYKMAAYCRLSRDDGENRSSESIENQIKIIREYIEKSEDLELADSYIDDGFSGMYFSNRPQFQRMMKDIYEGKIQGIITKDISRLGREHIETSHYIERVFPSIGIRFIAILDGLDSISHRNEELAQFQTLFNDIYCRDISKKIRGSLEVQKRRGNFMSGFAPYGYKKDPENKHRFLIDTEAAQVIQRIFSLYLTGYSKGSIAKLLNEEGILRPSEYKRRIQKLNYTNAREKSAVGGWTYPTIHGILKNRVYIGDMVQHKTEKISYKIDQYRYIPPNEQIIVADTHAAIIDKNTFVQVQELLKRRARNSEIPRESTKKNHYIGIILCGECGRPMIRKERRNGYECALYHQKGNAYCRSHFIEQSILDYVIKIEIKRQMKTLLEAGDEFEIWGREYQKIVEKNRSIRKKERLENRKKELKKIEKYKKKTYENYEGSVINQEEYARYQKDYTEKEKNIQKEIERIRAEKEYGKILEIPAIRWIENGEITEITRGILIELIDRIVVNEKKTLDIFCKYQSPYK